MCHPCLNTQIVSVILIRYIKVHTDINQIYRALSGLARPYSTTEVAKAIKNSSVCRQAAILLLDGLTQTATQKKKKNKNMKSYLYFLILGAL